MPEVVKIWLAQIRAPFLLLAVFLVAVGGAAAHEDGTFHSARFLMCMVGMVLAHASVNLFNELSDYRTKIDENTRRTPFSGGSGTLQAGLLTPEAVEAAAVGTLLAAAVIGLFLAIVSRAELLILILLGGVVTATYTTHLTRWLLGEVAAGFSLGSLVVVGTYIALTGTVTLHAILLSVPPGILTGLLLLLNEFPDMEADKRGGRKHIVIVLGRRKSAVVYAVAVSACYMVVLGGAVARIFPATAMLAFLTLPLAVKASVTALKHGDDFERMIPAMAANVGLVLGTDLLLAVGYLLA